MRNGSSWPARAGVFDRVGTLLPTSWLAAKDPALVKELLGHASLTSTEVYLNSRELHQMNAFAQVAC